MSYPRPDPAEVEDGLVQPIRVGIELEDPFPSTEDSGLVEPLCIHEQAVAIKQPFESDDVPACKRAKLQVKTIYRACLFALISL